MLKCNRLTFGCPIAERSWSDHWGNCGELQGGRKGTSPSQSSKFPSATCRVNAAASESVGARGWNKQENSLRSLHSHDHLGNIHALGSGKVGTARESIYY